MSWCVHGGQRTIWEFIHFFFFLPPGSWQLNSGHQVLMPLPSDLPSSGGCVLNLKMKCVFWWIPCRMWETGRSQGFCIWGGGINTGVKCFTNVITWKYFRECFPISISGLEMGSEWKGMWQVRQTLAGWRFHLKYKDYAFFSVSLPQRLLSSLINQIIHFKMNYYYIV